MNSGSLPASKMEFCVIIGNSIEKSTILDVPGVSAYIIVIIRFGLQWRWQEIFNLRFVSIFPYATESGDVRPIKDKVRLIAHSCTSLS